MNRAGLSLGIPLLALALLAPSVDATQVIYRSPQQLGQDATLVVDGRVTSVRSYWNETRSKILTEAVVAVEGTYKGARQSTVRIVQLGGIVGNVKMNVHGAVSWHDGEEVLLFLEPSLPGAYQVAGFSQGKYRIERDPRSGKRFVQHVVPGGTEFLGAPGAPGTASTPTQLPLDEFVDGVFGRR
jgi:hypothetical protein